MLRRILAWVVRKLALLRAQLWGVVLALPVGVVLARLLGHDLDSQWFGSIVVACLVAGAVAGLLWGRRDLDRLRATSTRRSPRRAR